MKEEFIGTATTATYSTYKYDWFTDEILEWVRGAKSEADAVHNLKVILEHYENKKSFWKKLKKLFK